MSPDLGVPASEPACLKTFECQTRPRVREILSARCLAGPQAATRRRVREILVMANRKG